MLLFAMSLHLSLRDPDASVYAQALEDVLEMVFSWNSSAFCLRRFAYWLDCETTCRTTYVCILVVVAVGTERLDALGLTIQKRRATKITYISRTFFQKIQIMSVVNNFRWKKLFSMKSIWTFKANNCVSHVDLGNVLIVKITASAMTLIWAHIHKKWIMHTEAKI